VCSDGACVDRSTTRTIGGTFQTLYRPDDGTTTIVGQPRPDLEVATAVLVPDQSAQGYARFPVTVAADGTFSVQNAPAGSWYLQLDEAGLASDGSQPSQLVNATYTRLLPMYSSHPDLSSVIAARPDLLRATKATPVAVTLSGILPSAVGYTRILATSSQADIYGMLNLLKTDTSYSGSIDWTTFAFRRQAGLPQAGKNDSVVWYQRNQELWSTPAGQGNLRRAVRFARTTDLTLADGQSATTSATLADAPQTGSFDLDLKTSAFAALASEVGPQARFAQITVHAHAAPRAVAYPDRPPSRYSLLNADVQTTADVHLTAPYGQFLGAGWQEMKTLEMFYEVTVAGNLRIAYSVIYRAAADMPGIIAGPVISPPTNLRINGQSATAIIRGAGLQPTLSWSAPRIGSATSYLVTIEPLSGVAAGDTASLSVLVDGATTFKVPPGFLKARTYYATIAAQNAPWDGPGRRPLREGTPLSYAEAVTAEFEP
jgi:hypothetical protein